MKPCGKMYIVTKKEPMLLRKILPLLKLKIKPLSFSIIHNLSPELNSGLPKGLINGRSVLCQSCNLQE